MANDQLKLFTEKYEASEGTEYFLSFENSNREIVYAFCRLRVNSDKTMAFIRELHTYGQSLLLKHKNIKTLKQSEVQHRGLGKKLIEEAEKICKKNKIKKIEVIAGVGVRNYYRKLGYKLENTYMVKKLR